MKIQDVVARCSRFSGFNLVYKITGGSHPTVEICEPGRADSKCVFGLLTENLLSEIYGRKSHWGITIPEQFVIAAALRAARTDCIVSNPELLDKLNTIKLFKTSVHQSMHKCADQMIKELKEEGLDMTVYESMYNVHSTGFSR